jgi:hypothetical protein
VLSLRLPPTKLNRIMIRRDHPHDWDMNAGFSAHSFATSNLPNHQRSEGVALTDTDGDGS